MAVTANGELAKLRVEQVRGDVLHFPFRRQSLFFPFSWSERSQKLNEHPFELREKMCGEDRLQRFSGAIHTCYLNFGNPMLLYFFSSSTVSSSWIEAAAAILSPSSRRKRRTPCVERPASRISFAWTRITFPYSVMIITSDSSVTWSAATTGPLRSVDLRLITPLPPRDVMRYSASGVRLPKPFSETVSISEVKDCLMTSFSSSSRFCVSSFDSFLIISKSGCTGSIPTR